MTQQLLAGQHLPADAEDSADQLAGWEDSAPLSFAQQRLWFVEQLAPNQPTYNIPLAIRLKGKLDAAALEQSLEEIVRRHTVLRTVICSSEGQPTQRVLDEFSLGLGTVDLHSASLGDGGEGELQRRLAAEARRPFDSAGDLMLRAVLFRLGDADWVLSLVGHHIAADGWSLSVLFRELNVLYEAFSRKRPSPLPELPLQYADYAIWQRENLQGEELERLLFFWSTQLAGAPSVLELPTDFPRPAIQTFQGNLHTFTLSPMLVERLRRLSQQERVTLFTTLFSTFQVLLSRYTRQDDVVVGVPVAGRDQVELEPLIGLFVNTLVCRTPLQGNPSFRELLCSVHHRLLDVWQHQQLPLEKLVEHLQPQRDLSRSPLFQVMFSLQNTPRSEVALGSLEAQRIDTSAPAAKCDLTVSVIESASELRVKFAYNVALFRIETIRRLASHWRTLLEAAVEHPGKTIAEWPLMKSGERRQVVRDWNQTSRAYPQHLSLKELFEAQVERTADSAAVGWNGENLSYRELNRRANRLAHFLQSQGIRQGDFVAVCLERSFDLMIALLGIIKAGGAYVPLDRDYPSQRLTLMLEDATAPFVVCDSAASDLFADCGVNAIELDRQQEQIQRCSDTNPTTQADGSDLAYVMYTSGSTGRPKGTCIPQRAVARLVLNTDYVQLGPDDVVAQASNCSFDAATFEIWGALLNGARLEIVAKETLMRAQDLAAQIDAAGITTLFITTALFNQLVEQSQRTFAGLKHLLFGGEAVSPRHVAQLLAGHPPRRLLHVYGPTETTTFATWQLVESADANTRTVPIGRPIANTTIYLLDRRQQPVPVGIPGEIYIGGDGVATGYWKRPELTAERFVPDPFNPMPSRLYKTGDLARRLPVGSIEFLGRLDHQVKLRGFRIELGEIERSLESHPAVQQCVVMAREDVPGNKRLVAYVVAQPGQSMTASQLRTFLERLLPAFMLPSGYVMLDELPLCVNGKVDRGAIPAADASAFVSAAKYVAPRTETERKVTKIWSETLGVDRLGIKDNFFDLGGHSLLAVCLFAEIEDQLGVSLPLAALFQSPTVEAVSELIDGKQTAAFNSPLVPLQTQGDRLPFYFVHGGGGSVMLFRNITLSVGKHQPFYGLHSDAAQMATVPPDRVEDMAAMYLNAIRNHQQEGPYYLGGYSSGGLVAFEIAQQLIAQGQQVALLVLFDTVLPQVIKSQFSLRRRLTSAVKRHRRRIVRPFFHAVYGICGYLGWRVPHPVRNACYRMANRRASESYVPEPINMPVTFFRATGGSVESLTGWPELAGLGIEVYDFKKRHNELLYGDTTQLSAALESCLERTQTAATVENTLRPAA